MLRAVGIEEELLVVDPDTRLAVPRAPAVLRGQRPDDGVEAELFRHQVEIQTEPTTDPTALHDAVRRARAAAGRAVDAAGLALAASGAAPLAAEPVVSADDRYRDLVATYGEVARGAGLCGMHVHVDVASPELGVRVIDRITPWLPVLLALSANSPVADGRDTGYASWRLQRWSAWPSSGAGQPLGSLAAYRQLAADLIASGAARDTAMLYLDARPAERYPTIEVRICDVVTDPADAVLLAVLARALVETAAREDDAGHPTPIWRVELLRAARWRASHEGVGGRLLRPGTAEPAPAREVVAALRDHVADALAEAGDDDLVDTGIARVLAGGGASRQRAALERTGSIEGVVDDLLTRTAASWG